MLALISVVRLTYVLSSNIDDPKYVNIQTHAPPRACRIRSHSPETGPICTGPHWAHLLQLLELLLRFTQSLVLCVCVCVCVCE
jgi:hypothetical protein